MPHPRTSSTLSALLLLIVTAIGATVAAGPSEHNDPHRFVRGMTVSCPGSGQIWGTDAMVEAMAELKAMGVNWIAIHPYAGIDADGNVGGRYRSTTWLTRPIEEAHRLGLKIMIKPHIAYWGSPFAWRGEISFQTDEQWERFFQTYETWITSVAELSKDADAFAVGTELDKTIGKEAQWRRVIKAVREKTSAPLTYSANWDRFEQVPFWDALDVVGIQSYFPLVGHDLPPSEAELTNAWKRLVTRLEVFSEAEKRPILLAELGYNRSAHAAVRPWDYRTGGEQAEIVQQRCMNAALGALDSSDAIVGAFLWKWFPGRPRRGNFLMTAPEMRAVIEQHWKSSALPDTLDAE